MATFKKVLCLILSIAMVFSLAACGNDNTESIVNLGGDEEWGIEVDAPSGTESSTSSGNKAPEVSVPEDSGQSTTVKTPAVKNADDLSWKDLLAQMPSDLRGTTIKVYSWNPIKDVTGAEKVISDFEKQTGIKVDWTVGNYDNYESEIAALINSGNSPDIIRYNNPAAAKMYLTQDIAINWGFPGDSLVKKKQKQKQKNPPANAGDMGSIHGSGRPPREGNGNPLQ